MHANEIVRIHDSVNKAIQHNGQIHIAIIVDMRVEPIKEKDGNVMIDVKKGELTPFLAQNNKDGIPKVPHFGNVKEPQQIGQRRIGLTVRFTWQELITVAISYEEGFNGHV
jgi:hypothetical protein